MRSLSFVTTALLAAAIAGPAQAQIHVFEPSPIDGAQSGTSSTGTGLVNCVLDLSTNTFSWHVVYSGLTSPVIAAHFHGPAAPGQNGPVVITIGLSSPDTGSAPLTAQEAQDVLNGLWYVNIHTTNFPGGEIRGQVNPANTKVVINEIMYDGVGSDNGQTFVELAGPPGTDITGWRVVNIEAGSATSCGTVNNGGADDFTCVGNIQPDGLFVMADDDGTGNTLVQVDPGHNGGAPDMLFSDIDVENGTDAFQLVHPTGLVVDAVTYGSGALCTVDVNGDPIVEGSPAFDVFGGFSLERWPQGNDTDDNSVDFTAQCSPSAGASVEPRAFFFNGSTSISGAAGGSLGMDIHSARPGSQYIVFAFLTSPTTKDTLSLPFDPVTTLFITLATTPNPLVVGFVGTLDATGFASATLTVPAGTAIPAPVTLSFVGATVPINPGSIATNPIDVTFNP